MTVGLTVGVLADLDENDPEGVDMIQTDFAAINKMLQDFDLPSHHEPSQCEVTFNDGFPHTWINALCEVAGLVAVGRSIPMNQVILGEYTPYANDLFDALLPYFTGLEYEKVLENPTLLKGGGLPGMPPFVQLLSHNRFEGYYIPVDAAVPLMPLSVEEGKNVAWPVGSAQRLRSELLLLAAALKIPKPESFDLRQVDPFLHGDPPPDPVHLWQAQPLATLVLIDHLNACNQSLKTGAAISYG